MIVKELINELEQCDGAFIIETLLLYFGGLWK